MTGCLKPEITPYLSAYTRECADTGQESEILDLSNVDEIAQRYANTSAAEKLDKLLRLVGKRIDFHGAQARFSPGWDYPVIRAKNREEVIFHRSELEKQDYIEVKGEDAVVITHKGWERLERTSLRADDKETGTKKWDVFICHASEDKEQVLEPLAEALQTKGLKVWYDRWVLTIGDSLRRSIDEGLKESRFGVVVLSPAFFVKNWPQWELDGLVQREIGGQKVILPVWHNVTRVEVAKYSLPLADRVAGSTTEGIKALADELLQAIKAEGTSVQAPTTQRDFPRTTTVPTKPSQPEEKWVDMHYPHDSGLLRQLEAEGYRVRWRFDRDVARAVDIEAWELVHQDLGDGRVAMLKLRDRPDNQTLLKKRHA